MRYKKIELIPGRAEVYLEFFGNEDTSGICDAMLVIPGGGYGCVCADREGYPIALAYMAHGLNTFVLHYSVGDDIREPVDPLWQAAIAMAHIRDNADSYNVDAERVFVVGFSAGGHLAGSLAILWDMPELTARLERDTTIARPTGAILCYPVISAFEFAHRGSFDNLLRDLATCDEALERFSLERHVSSSSSPSFIMHTFDDELVPVENALLLAQAYARAKTPCEMHIYPHAPHGIALANRVTWCGNPDLDNPAIAKWVENSIMWMRSVR